MRVLSCGPVDAQLFCLPLPPLHVICARRSTSSQCHSLRTRQQRRVAVEAHRDAYGSALLAITVIVGKVAPGVPSLIALVQALARTALSNRHGIHAEFRTCLRQLAGVEAQLFAEGVGAVVVVPEEVAADRVPLALVAHLGIHGLAGTDGRAGGDARIPVFASACT